MATRARRVAALVVLAALLALPAAAPSQGPGEAPAPAPPEAPAPGEPPAPAEPPEPPLPPSPLVLAPFAVPPAALLPGGVQVGIADQKPDMFADARFAALGLRHARLAIGWDAMASAWQVQELDRWLAGAKALGVQPLISFGHSRTQRHAVPRPDRLRAEFRKLRRRYPWVKTFATWNEANHCGEPVCHRPTLVAGYYRAMRRECPSCKILAAEILDMPNAVGYVRAFRRKLGYTPKTWGVHNYVEANRFHMARLRRLLRALPGADVWLTETGGLVRRDNASTTDIPEGARHATEVTRYLFDRVLPRNPRVKAIYIYHWNAGPPSVSWDSGLITPGGNERASLSVVRRVLRFGLRPNTSFRSPSSAVRPSRASDARGTR
jgi:hypothetical protein